MNLIKTEQEIERMRQAGKIWAKTMNEIEGLIKPGISLKEIDKFAEKSIREQGGIPGFLGYKPESAQNGFPATICASVNEIFVHAVPSERKLKEGDILTIDMGVIIGGYNVDAAVTFAVGQISEPAKKLLNATKLALDKAIDVAKPGATLGDIGAAVEAVARENNLHIAKGLTGHGIGKNLHEEPMIRNTGTPGEGMPLQPGMCIAIEPMLAIGTGEIIRIKEDESYATKDGSLSAHYEHTLTITENGNEVLTK